MTSLLKVKKERSDKIKNKAKVIAIKLSNPLASEREVAEKAWVWNGTSHRILKDMEQNGASIDSIKIDAIEKIIQKDLTIVELAQAELEKRLKHKPEDMSARDIIASADTSAKRYSLFKWSATDEEWWLKEQVMNINLLSNDELLKIALWK